MCASYRGLLVRYDAVKIVNHVPGVVCHDTLTFRAVGGCENEISMRGDIEKVRVFHSITVYFVNVHRDTELCGQKMRY